MQAGPSPCERRSADSAAVQDGTAGAATDLTALEAARLQGFVDGAEVSILLVQGYGRLGFGLDLGKGQLLD